MSEDLLKLLLAAILAEAVGRSPQEPAGLSPRSAFEAMSSWHQQRERQPQQMGRPDALVRRAWEPVAI